MKEKTKHRLFVVSVVLLALVIFVGACLCIWEGLCIFYDVWKANTEGKHEFTAAADAPYFKMGNADSDIGKTTLMNMPQPPRKGILSIPEAISFPARTAWSSSVFTIH